MWSDLLENKSMAWVSWKSVCKPKDSGEVGIKDSVLFNRALLTKWLWRFIKENDAIWVGVLEQRYENIARRLISKCMGTLLEDWWMGMFGS